MMEQETPYGYGLMVKLETVSVERRRERKREELCVDGLLYNVCILFNQ
jgi:hypothetical protein